MNSLLAVLDGLLIWWAWRPTVAEVCDRPQGAGR
jgi:hypothetical protein